MAGINSKFANGIDGWYDYKPTGEQRTDERIAHRMMSAVAAVIPEPYAVVGTTQGTPLPLDIVALSEHLAVRIMGKIAEPVIDVWPISTLERVRVDSTPLTSTGVMGIQAIDTTFTLFFSWGEASVERHHGTETERQSWMKTYIGILASR